ncbi:MAG TPA: 4Fe-4S binding protein, partial [Methanomassiliicoccaceae archaeon]|nr:4Fe-4S binding protein [Methanomassiliicoccaceae archaeon]
TYEALFADKALARYKPAFDRMRAMRPHQLSDELETFLHDQSVVGASAWNKLFDETTAALTFPVAGEPEPLGLEATLNLLTDHDRARREAGAKALLRSQLCTQCGICLRSCPTKALRLDDGIVVNEEKCTSCGRCAEACVVAHYYDKLVT